MRAWVSLPDFLISDYPHFARCEKAGETCAASDRPLGLTPKPLDTPSEKSETVSPHRTLVRLRLTGSVVADVGRAIRITKGTGFLDLEGHANVYPLLMISE